MHGVQGVGFSYKVLGFIGFRVYLGLGLFGLRV